MNNNNCLIGVYTNKHFTFDESKVIGIRRLNSFAYYNVLFTFYLTDLFVECPSHKKNIKQQQITYHVELTQLSNSGNSFSLNSNRLTLLSYSLVFITCSNECDVPFQWVHSGNQDSCSRIQAYECAIDVVMNS